MADKEVGEIDLKRIPTLERVGKKQNGWEKTEWDKEEGKKRGSLARRDRAQRGGSKQTMLDAWESRF